jgi:hypothetical protein
MRNVTHCFLIGAALSFAFASSPIYAINATIDVSNVIRTIPDNARALHTSVYAEQFTNGSLDDRLIEAGVQMLRYPGGSYSDLYHFSIPATMPYYTCCNAGVPDVTQPHPLTPLQGADPAVDPPGDEFPFGYYPSSSNFGSFINLVDATGANAMITVNYGSSLGNFDAGSGKWLSTKGGQPAEAAAWVAFANADPSIYNTANDVDLGVDAEGIDWKTAGYWAKLRASDNATDYQNWATTDGVYDPANAFLAINRDAPVGIKYWEIGNEINGNGFYGGTGWEEDLHEPYDGSRSGDVDLSPQTYGANLVQFAAAMKAVDPTIQIGGVMVGSAPGAVGNTGNINTNWDRRMLLAAGDATVTVNDETYNALDFGILHWYVGNSGQDCSSNIDACEASILNATAAQLPGVYQTLRDRVDLYTTTRDGDTFPIHMTEFGYFDNIQGNNPVTGVFAADVIATALEQGAESVHFLEMSSLFMTGSASLSRLAGFRGYQMLDHFFDAGDELVDATSGASSLKAYGVRQADGTVAIMLINLDDNNDATVDLSISGATLASTGTQWLWGSGTPATPTDTALSDLGNEFSILVPDHTVMILLIASVVEEPILIGDYNNDGKVSAADYTVWRDSVGAASLQNRDPDNVGPVDLNDYDSWIDHYGEASGEGSGSAILAGSVPEPSSLMLACLALVALATRFRARPRMA